MAGFERTLDELFDRGGAGVGARRRLRRGRADAQMGAAAGRRRVVGVDLEDPKLEAEWARAARPTSSSRRCAQSAAVRRSRVRPRRGDRGPGARPGPERALAEMARVARGYLLVSVPREPLWRALNIARGAYVRDLGNTPGHLNHWSRRAFVGSARALRRGRPDAVAVPVDDAAGQGGLMSPPGCRRPPSGEPRPPTSRAARTSPELVRVGRPRPVDRDRLDRASSRSRTWRPPATFSTRRVRAHLALLGDHVRDPVGHLPADRAAAVAHDRRPPRAGAARARRCGCRRLIQFGFAVLFLVVALVLRPQIEQGMFEGSRPSTGSSWSA